jgi:hypothetical protein
MKIRTFVLFLLALLTAFIVVGCSSAPDLTYLPANDDLEFEIDITVGKESFNDYLVINTDHGIVSARDDARELYFDVKDGGQEYMIVNFWGSGKIKRVHLHLWKSKKIAITP